MLTAKPISSPRWNAGCVMKKSGRWPEPSSGSFRRIASPGRSVSTGCAASAFLTAKDMAPMWPGEYGPCATMRPCASKTATEKSWPSRACSEYAVLCTVVPISTAIDCRAPQTTPSVIGSTRALTGAPSARQPRAGPSSGARLHDEVRVLVDGRHHARRQHRRRLALLDDRGPVQPRAGRQGVAVVDGALGPAARLRKPRAAPALQPAVARVGRGLRQR